MVNHIHEKWFDFDIQQYTRLGHVNNYFWKLAFSLVLWNMDVNDYPDKPGFIIETVIESINAIVMDSFGWNICKYKHITTKKYHTSFKHL